LSQREGLNCFVINHQQRQARIWEHVVSINILFCCFVEKLTHSKFRKMGNSFTCISHEQEQRPKKSSGGGGNNSGKYKYVRRLSLMPSFRRRTLLPSLSCSGSSSTSSSKKGGIKAKTKKIRERHHHHHQDHEKDSHIIQEQTLAATNLLFNQTPRNSNSVVPPSFRRSTSVVYPSAQPSGTSSGPVSAVQTPKKSSAGFVRSSSSRQRSSTDPMIKPNQLVDKASTCLKTNELA